MRSSIQAEAVLNELIFSLKKDLKNEPKSISLEIIKREVEKIKNKRRKRERNDFGINSIVHFSPLSGKGVIYKKRKKTLLISIEKGRVKILSANNTNISMWMGGNSDLIEFDGGKSPYNEMKEFVLKKYKKEMKRIKKMY